MSKQKFTQWIKEHKKELIIGTVSAVGVGVLGYFGVKRLTKNPDQVTFIPRYVSGTKFKGEEFIEAHLEAATVTEAWKEFWEGGSETTNLILNDFKPADIGKLGEELIEKVPGVTEDTVLTCVLGTTIQ